MKWLYILFTLVMDTPNVPISNPSVPNTLVIKLIDIPFLKPLSSGMDERFTFVSNEEELERIRLHFYYLEQIRKLESNTKTLELVMPIVNDVLPLYEISSGRMNAGGLMDDWERNI